MGIINTSSFAKDLWPGVNAWYGTEYKKYPVEHLEIFERQKTTRAFEEDVGMTGFGLAPVKTQGGSIYFDESEQGFIDRYTPVTYGIGFIITREMYDDGIAAIEALKKATSLAFSIRQTMENVAANVLNRAFSNSYVYGDGVELCSTAHPNKSGGTYRNELATAADLSEASLEQMCIDIAGLTTDRGLKIAIRPQKLVIPKELIFEAERFLNSDLQPATANNDINAIKSLGVIPKVVTNHYLTDTDAYFIVTDCPHGMKFMDRRSMDFDVDNEFDTENAKFKATFRGAWGCTDKRSVFGSPGA